MASEINAVEINDITDDFSTETYETGHNVGDILIGVGVGLAIPVAIKAVKKGITWVGNRISKAKRDKFEVVEDEDYDDYEELDEAE